MNEKRQNSSIEVQQELPKNTMQSRPAQPEVMTAAQREASAALEVAKRAQALRRQAPIATGRQTDCVAWQIINRIATSQGGQYDPVKNKQAPFYFFFDEKTNLKDLAHKGAEPVIEQGEFVHNETDILYQIPSDLWKKDRDSEAAASNARIYDVVAEENRRNKEQNRAPEESDRTIIGAKGTPEWNRAHSEAALSPV